MKKGLIAAIVITLIIPAAAIAEVKVSGQIQAEVMSFEQGTEDPEVYLADGAESGVGQGNASAIGVKFDKELENGLTAFGKVNFNFQADDGDWGEGLALKQRDVYVGLKSDPFGQIAVGRMNSAYKASTCAWDPFLACSLQARADAGMSSGHNGYASDVVEYANKLGPVAVKAQALLDESGNNDDGMSASLSVPVGPIEVVGAYLTPDSDSDTWKVGAKVTVGDTPLTVAVQYEDTESYGYGARSAVEAEDAVVDAATGRQILPAVSAQDAVSGEGEFIYGNISVKIGDVTPVVGYGLYNSEAGNSDAAYIAVGVLYNLGESTRLHFGYRETNSDIDDNDVVAVAIGIRQKF